jgi:hypothetical protein
MRAMADVMVARADDAGGHRPRGDVEIHPAGDAAWCLFATALNAAIARRNG